MRVLHLVKTSDGARWAAEQVKVLVREGHEIGVILPSPRGKMLNAWRSSGAKLYFGNVELPVKRPWEYNKRRTFLNEVVEDFRPELVHSHFFSTTILARQVLKLPVAFQVPGPLHMESALFKKWDLMSARPNDFWIASSHAIRELYLNEGVPGDRVGMSYYGNEISDYDTKSLGLRKELKFSGDDYIVGNISYFYPPKKYLFQTSGLKGHELMFEGLGLIKNRSIKGVFWGEQWGGSKSYEKKLQSLCPINCQMPGALKPFEVSRGWKTMDVCIHMPYSENCGGVLEPLLHEVPVIACNVGGLSELIVNNKTGLLVERASQNCSDAILYAYKNRERMQNMAVLGSRLARKAFDVNRTAKEISTIYREGLNVFNRSLFYSKELL